MATTASNQRVIAKYRQYYFDEETIAEDRYCLLNVSEKKKQQLLSGDKGAEDEVMVALFRAELLLVGNGLCHEISFLEEKGLVGCHNADVLTL